MVRAANMRTISAVEMGELIDNWRTFWNSGVIAPRRLDASLVSAATRLAVRLGHPLPDCIYLALAIELDCELATCDAKFLAKAVRLYPAVRVLDDYLR